MWSVVSDIFGTIGKSFTPTPAAAVAGFVSKKNPVARAIQNAVSSGKLPLKPAVNYTPVGGLLGEAAQAVINSGRLWTGQPAEHRVLGEAARARAGAEQLPPPTVGAASPQSVTLPKPHAVLGPRHPQPQDPYAQLNMSTPDVWAYAPSTTASLTPSVPGYTPYLSAGQHGLLQQLMDSKNPQSAVSRVQGLYSTGVSNVTGNSGKLQSAVNSARTTADSGITGHTVDPKTDADAYKTKVEALRKEGLTYDEINAILKQQAATSRATGILNTAATEAGKFDGTVTGVEAPVEARITAAKNAFDYTLPDVAGSPVGTFTAGYRASGVPRDQLVQAQLADILSEDNPLMRRARAQAMDTAASRGLLNSSMAVSAAQAAMLDAALPIATHDADVYAQTERDLRSAELAAGDKLLAADLARKQEKADLSKRVALDEVSANLNSQQRNIDAANQAHLTGLDRALQSELSSQDAYQRGLQQKLSTEANAELAAQQTKLGLLSDAFKARTQSLLEEQASRDRASLSAQDASNAMAKDAQHVINDMATRDLLAQQDLVATGADAEMQSALSAQSSNQALMRSAFGEKAAQQRMILERDINANLKTLGTKLQMVSERYRTVLDKDMKKFESQLEGIRSDKALSNALKLDMTKRALDVTDRVNKILSDPDLDDDSKAVMIRNMISVQDNLTQALRTVVPTLPKLDFSAYVPGNPYGGAGARDARDARDARGAPDVVIDDIKSSGNKPKSTYKPATTPQFSGAFVV